MISRDTRKVSQNPSMTNLFSWFQSWCCTVVKNEVKRSSHAGDLLYKTITQSDLQRFRRQNSRARLLNCLQSESISCFYECLSIFHKMKVTVQFGLDILQIYYRKLLLGWPGVPGHTHMNRMNHRCIYVYLRHSKSQIHA